MEDIPSPGVEYSAGIEGIEIECSAPLETFQAKMQVRMNGHWKMSNVPASNNYPDSLDLIGNFGGSFP